MRSSENTVNEYENIKDKIIPLKDYINTYYMTACRPNLSLIHKISP